MSGYEFLKDLTRLYKFMYHQINGETDSSSVRINGFKNAKLSASMINSLISILCIQRGMKLNSSNMNTMKGLVC